MSFHTQSFESRHGTMGDTAEGVFDQIHGDRVHRLGLNREWANGKRLTLTSMTHPMRYTPDRMIGHCFVEIMGIGRDQTLKLKVEKLMALQSWKALGPVELFVYDSKNKRWWQSPIGQWTAACLDAPVEEFHDGKKYFALHADNFPTTPTKVQHEA